MFSFSRFELSHQTTNMGPVQVFVILAAISSALGSDESLKPKPLIPKFQDAVNSMDLPVLKSTKEGQFILKSMNESWDDSGTRDSVNFNIEKRALDCGSYILTPGHSAVIQSTNFPDNYPQNDGCTWTFEASTPNSTISINCNPFKLKNCMFSTLAITGGNLNKIFCGNEKEDIQASSSDNKMKVVFKSKMMTSQGFQCTVSASGTDQENRSCANCGVMRILYGNEATPNEFPWQAALVYGRTNYPFCGGVVYNRFFIMTAAHCIQAIFYYGLTPEVLLGAHNLIYMESTQQRSWVKHYYPHQGFDPVSYDNDIGLIELASPAIFNNFVQPACLPGPYQDHLDYDAIVSGWGATEISVVSSILLKADFKILPNSECESLHNTAVTTNMICAGHGPYYLTGTCNGDSGGPLVVFVYDTPVVIGLLSYGPDTGCSEILPSVFTKISYYLYALASIAGQGSYCSTK